jgi:hypothetical protein
MTQRDSHGRFTKKTKQAIEDDLESESQEGRDEDNSGSESREGDSERDEDNSGSESREGSSEEEVLESGNSSATSSEEMENQNQNLDRNIPKAPTFNGQGNIEAFISKYRAHAHLAHLTEPQAVERLQFSLCDEAYDEYFRLWHGHLPACMNDAMNSLLTTFSEGKQDAAEWAAEYKLWQEESQTVEAYLKVFRKEQDKYDGPIADGALRSSFIKGLQPKIAKRVHYMHPNTLLEAINQARIAEREVRFSEDRKKEWTLAYPPKVDPNVRPTFNRLYQPRNNQEGPPRLPMGGGQRTYEGPPRFQMGGAPPLPKPTLPIPRPVAKENEEMEALLKQFEQVRIGSSDHQEWQRWAMSDGRCLKCMRKGHISRNCPSIPHVRSMQLTHDQDLEEQYAEEYDCDAIEEEQDPQWA